MLVHEIKGVFDQNRGKSRVPKLPWNNEHMSSLIHDTHTEIIPPNSSTSTTPAPITDSFPHEHKVEHSNSWQQLRQLFDANSRARGSLPALCSLINGPVSVIFPILFVAVLVDQSNCNHYKIQRGQTLIFSLLDGFSRDIVIK